VRRRTSRRTDPQWVRAKEIAERYADVARERMLAAGGCLEVRKLSAGKTVTYHWMFMYGEGVRQMRVDYWPTTGRWMVVGGTCKGKVITPEEACSRALHILTGEPLDDTRWHAPAATVTP
jgi:hypothetical protein